MAFLDINPATDKGGHTLILPKKHYELLTEIPEKELSDIMKTTQKLAKALLKLYPGLNLLQNNKKVAGQIVPHFHFHLIPRYENDGIKISYWKTHKYGPEGDKKIVEKIKANLN